MTPVGQPPVPSSLCVLSAGSETVVGATAAAGGATVVGSTRTGACGSVDLCRGCGCDDRADAALDALDDGFEDSDDADGLVDVPPEVTSLPGPESVSPGSPHATGTN